VAQDIADRAQNALTAEIRVAVPERSLKHDLRAVSIVWRREFGFLREMLVAPVRRRDDGGADQADPGVHGAHPDVRDAAVLLVRRAVPAQRAARLAETE
jgi:hypothetical protein